MRPSVKEKELLDSLGFRESRNKPSLWTVEYEGVVVSADYRRPDRKPFPSIFGFPKSERGEARGEFVDRAVLDGLPPVKALRGGLRALLEGSRTTPPPARAAPRAQESQPAPTQGPSAPPVSTREASKPQGKEPSEKPAPAGGSPPPAQAGAGEGGSVSLAPSPVIVIRAPDDMGQWHNFEFPLEDRDEIHGKAMEENIRIMRDCLEDARGLLAEGADRLLVGQLAVALFEKAALVPHFEFERWAQAKVRITLTMMGRTRNRKPESCCPGCGMDLAPKSIGAFGEEP